MASRAQLDLEVQMKGADKAAGDLKGISKEANLLGKAMGGLKGGLGAIGGAATIAAGAVGIFGAGLLGAAKAAADEKVGIDRLNQTLKNVIPNWDGNTTAVEAYITKTEKLAFADDDLRDSLNALVMQTGDLTEAQNLQAIAMDLARAKGMDLETASKLVGKVDAENIGILARYGIQIDENATKEEALAIIREKTAGQAQTFADSAAGSMERAQNAIGNAVETIGGSVLKLLEGPLAGFTDFLESAAFQGAIQSAADFIGTGLTKAFDAIGKAIEIATPFVKPFTDAIGTLISDLSGGKDIWESFGTALGSIGTALADLAGKIIQWLKDNIGPISAQLLEWAGAFIAWIAPMIPPLLLELGKIVVGIGTWIINDALPAIASKLVEWGKAFLDWIGPILPQIPGKLGEIINTITTWIMNDALPAIGTELAKWGKAFLEWVGPILPQIPGALWGFLTAIGDWITNDMVPGVAKFFEENAYEIAKGLGTAFLISISLLPATLALVVVGIGKAIIDNLPGMWTAVTNAFGLGLEGIPDAAADSIKKAAQKTVIMFVNELKHGLSFLVPIGFLLPDIELPEGYGEEAARDIGTNMVEAFNSVAVAGFTQAGEVLPLGLALGVTANSGTALAPIGQLALDMIALADATFESRSPSQVFHRMGGDIDMGLGQGITANQGSATTPMTTMTTAILGIAQAAFTIANYKPFGEVVAGAVGAGVTALTPQATGATNSLVAGIKGAVAPNLTHANYDPYGRNVSKGILDGISALAGAAAQATAAMVSAIKAEAQALTQAYFKTYGNNVGIGLRDGIMAYAGQVAAAARKMVTDAINAARSALDSASPSKVFYEMGGDVDVGFAQGITAKGQMVQDATLKMVDERVVNVARARINALFANLPEDDIAAIKASGEAAGREWGYGFDPTVDLCDPIETASAAAEECGHSGGAAAAQAWIDGFNDRINSGEVNVGPYQSGAAYDPGNRGAGGGGGPPRRAMASGGAFWTNGPTNLLVGEAGREFVSVTPQGQMGMGGGLHIGHVTINAGMGANGAQIANDFLDQLRIQLHQAQSLATGGGQRVYG